MNSQEAEAFLGLLIAAMKDAVLEGKNTQLKTIIDPDGKGLRMVRIIVVPEVMEYNWPLYAPFGTPIKGN